MPSGPVLLVHDDIAVIAPAKRVLQREGIDSVLVTNAADAVIAFGDLAPLVVVLAAEVDGNRGADIYKEIRNHPNGDQVRFVLLGHGIPEAPEAAVVGLPLDGQALLEAVTRALEGDDVSAAWHLSEPGESPPASVPAPVEPQEPAADHPLADTLFDQPAEPAEPVGSEKPLAESLFDDLPADEKPPPPEQTEGASQLSDSLFADMPVEPPAATSAVELAEEILAEPPPEPEPLATRIGRDFEEAQRQAEEEGRIAAQQAALDVERDAAAGQSQHPEAASPSEPEPAAKQDESDLVAEPPESEAEQPEPAPAAAQPESAPAADLEQTETEELLSQAVAGKADREKELLSLKEANQSAQEEERRAQAERKRLEAEAQDLGRRRDEARKKAEAAQHRLDEEARRAEELRRVAEGQQQRVAEIRSREEEERAKIEALKAAAAEEERRAAEERRALEAEAHDIARRREELKKRTDAEKKKVEEDGRRTDELERMAEEHSARVVAARTSEESQREKLAELRRLAEEEEKKATEERASLEADAAQISRYREEAKKKIDSAQRQLEAEAAQAEALVKAAEDQKRKIAELRSREEAERRHVEELKQAVLDEERRAQEQSARLEDEIETLTRAKDEVKREADEARRRLEAEAVELAHRRSEVQRSSEEVRQKLATERAAIEQEEQKAKEAAEVALRQIDEERAQATRRAQQTQKAREEELRRARDQREVEQQQIRLREEEAQRLLEMKRPGASAEAERPEKGRVRPFASGKWRGPLRVTEMAERVAANDAVTQKMPVVAEADEPPEPGEGFKTGEPAAPTEPSFAPRGSLAQLDAPALLCRSFDGRLTGRIDVFGLDAQRTLWFEEGRLAAAASTSLVERLEDIALRGGLISQAQHHALRTSEETLARRLALQMVELGYIRASELYPLVKKRVLEIAFSLFLDDSSTYVFTGESPPAEERVVLPMHPYALAAEGIRRKFSTSRLWARLGGPATLLRPRAQGFDLDYLGLSAKEKRLAQSVDGLRTIEEILFEGGLEEAAALKVLYALAAASAVEIAVLGRAAKPASPEEAARLDLSRVAEKYNQVVAGDYFQMLGLRRDATAYEVRESYDKLAREFHPDRFLGLSDTTLFNRLTEIGRALAEAADVLADDSVREEYARNLLD